MHEQQHLGAEELRSLPASDTVVWTTARLAGAVSIELPGLPITTVPPPRGWTRVVAVGGGSFLDAAKLWRRAHSPSTWLCAVPSLWGSGAEASPIAVETVDGVKVAHTGADLLPEACAVLPALAASVPPPLAVWGMGDTWSHCLEAFLSPLADGNVRAECAALIRDHLLPAGVAPGPRWFSLSARACALQARAGVGLVHAIAHVLEPKVEGFGHAHLCSTFLFPVFRFDRGHGAKVASSAAAHGIDLDAVDSALRSLFDARDYEALLPALRRHWPEVLRHPLARINCALVRASSIQHFEAEALS